MSSGACAGSMFVELATVLVEGAVDHIAGRPRSDCPYSPLSALDLHAAWLMGWDECAEQLELRGQEEAARWLAA